MEHTAFPKIFIYIQKHPVGKGGCDNVVRSRDNPKIVIIDNLIIKRVIFAFPSQSKNTTRNCDISSYESKNRILFEKSIKLF
jgi:hypothetical protein